MIKWFDSAVVDMKIWETKTVEIQPKEGYGERSEEKLMKVSRGQLDESIEYEVGQTLYGQFGQKFKVHQTAKEHIVFDANHELAGKTLTFDITIKEIK